MDGHYEHCDRDEDDERIRLALGLKRSEGYMLCRTRLRIIFFKRKLDLDCYDPM